MASAGTLSAQRSETATRQPPVTAHGSERRPPAGIAPRSGAKPQFANPIGREPLPLPALS
ncbi:MAG: hypothetical protein F4174_07750 [Acidobacteria bacterium]|nr:hypothetical protein [Acidobacteriota bacterium]